jgi:hypothetical protein
MRGAQPQKVNTMNTARPSQLHPVYDRLKTSFLSWLLLTYEIAQRDYIPNGFRVKL